MRRLLSGFRGARPLILLALALVQFLLGYSTGVPEAWGLGVIFAGVACWLAWRAGPPTTGNYH